MQAPCSSASAVAIEIEFPVENVVAQNQRRAGAAEKIGADEKRLRDPFRLRLGRVFDPDAEPRAVAEIILQHRQIFWRGNDQHLAQPAEHQSGERIANHRLVVNGQQLLADDLGQRIEAGAGAARREELLSCSWQKGLRRPRSSVRVDWSIPARNLPGASNRSG